MERGEQHCCMVWIAMAAGEIAGELDSFAFLVECQWELNIILLGWRNVYGTRIG
jgi:hypothetical protein